MLPQELVGVHRRGEGKSTIARPDIDNVCLDLVGAQEGRIRARDDQPSRRWPSAGWWQMLGLLR